MCASFWPTGFSKVGRDILCWLHPPLAKVFVFLNKGILIEIGVSWKFLYEICPRVTQAKFDPSPVHAFVYARLRSCHVLAIKIERKTDRMLC